MSIFLLMRRPASLPRMARRIIPIRMAGSMAGGPPAMVIPVLVSWLNSTMSRLFWVAFLVGMEKK